MPITSLFKSPIDLRLFISTTLLKENNFIPLPISYGFDFMGEKEGGSPPVLATVVVSLNEEDEILLSSKKYIDILYYAKIFGASPNLIVLNPTGLYYTKITVTKNNKLNYDTGEPCVVYSLKKLTKIYDINQLLEKRIEYDYTISAAKKVQGTL